MAEKSAAQQFSYYEWWLLSAVLLDVGYENLQNLGHRYLGQWYVGHAVLLSGSLGSAIWVIRFCNLGH